MSPCPFYVWVIVLTCLENLNANGVSVSWDFFDFAQFTMLFLGVFACLIWAVRKAQNRCYRVGIALTLISIFLLIWGNGAVGIIGAENNDANMMFAVLPGIALVGTFLVRGQAFGMQRVLSVMAGVQLLIAIAALIMGFGNSGPGWLWDLIAMSAFFTALWLSVGLLFRRSVS